MRVALVMLVISGIAHAKPVGNVQIINSNAGRIETAGAEEYDHVVYIEGLAYRPSSPDIGAHVHAWGVDKHNRQVFFKTTDVFFTGKPSFIHTASYVISIDPAIFAKAAKVYVTLHQAADEQSLHSR